MHNWFQEIKSWVEAFVSRVHGTLVSKFVSVSTIATMYLALLSEYWLSIKGERDWKANDHWVAIRVFWGDTNHSVLGAEMLFRLDDLSFKPCQMIFFSSQHHFTRPHVISRVRQTPPWLWFVRRKGVVPLLTSPFPTKPHTSPNDSTTLPSKFEPGTKRLDLFFWIVHWSYCKELSKGTKREQVNAILEDLIELTIAEKGVSMDTSCMFIT